MLLAPWARRRRKIFSCSTGMLASRSACAPTDRGPDSVAAAQAGRRSRVALCVPGGRVDHPVLRPSVRPGGRRSHDHRARHRLRRGGGTHRVADKDGHQVAVPWAPHWRGTRIHTSAVSSAVRNDVLPDGSRRNDERQRALARTDALYFSVTVFTTVGFGDIAADSEVGRMVLTSQMLLNLRLIGVVGRLVLHEVRRSRQHLTPGAPREQS